MASLAEYLDSPFVIQNTAQGTTLVFQISSAVTWLLRILIPIIVTAIYLKLTQGRQSSEAQSDGEVPPSTADDDLLNITTVSPAQPRPFGSPTRKRIIPPTASSRCSSRASPALRAVHPSGSSNSRSTRATYLKQHHRPAQAGEQLRGEQLDKEDILRSATAAASDRPTELEGLGTSPRATVVAAARSVGQQQHKTGDKKSAESLKRGVKTAPPLPPGFGSVKEVGKGAGISLKNEDARKALQSAIDNFPSEASTVCQEVLQSLTLAGVIIEPQTYEAMIRAAEVSGDTELAGVLFNGVSILVDGDKKDDLGGRKSPVEDEDSSQRSAPAPVELPQTQPLGSQSPPGLSTAAASAANPGTPLTIVPQEESKDQKPEPMKLNAKAPEFVPAGYGTAPTTRFLDSLMDHRRAVAAARYYQNQFMAARYMGGLAAFAKAQMQAVQLAQAQGTHLSRYHPNAPSMPVMDDEQLIDWGTAAATKAEEEAQVQMRVKKIMDERQKESTEDPSKKDSTSQVEGKGLSNDAECSSKPDGRPNQLRVAVAELKEASPERKRELLGI
ncbi:hypothetical protein FOZ61_010097 [Perkinsus olseni]|nr:hypothetical protein FOZ61_010097 [Perkinsus olseni]